ncbi:GbsR/MarR family transcriptional regulator [Streptomyces griseus]|uniref:GbsR/MarR family transcriptional regulator n=1 Tax=Streptomyces griseus TaxID=1911 RepID=UPI0038253EAA
MPHEKQLDFADLFGRFYARQYGFPPMAGRVLGYLFVCDPPFQTIDQLSEALLASRSAVTGAVKLLEGYRMVRRTRAAGERLDRVSLDPVSQQPQHFDSAVHREHAAVFREGLALLTDAPPERRAPLEEMIALAEFLAVRLPALLEEWQELRGRLNQPADSTTVGTEADPIPAHQPAPTSTRTTLGEHSP